VAGKVFGAGFVRDGGVVEEAVKESERAG